MAGPADRRGIEPRHLATQMGEIRKVYNCVSLAWNRGCSTAPSGHDICRRQCIRSPRPALQGLFFRDLQGRPVGSLVRFASHPNITNLGGRPSDSGDYPVYVRRRLEKRAMIGTT